MRNDDVALIQRILTGDETAFESLIGKYQKQVHALAFRKVGDFQTAEDITQEAFLQVHQKLATLNDPAKFSGWLYAIVNHLCIAWYRKNRLETESLQEIYISEVETEAYSRYVATEHAKTTAAAQRDLVKRLLTKLKEGDREVITLHYFEEMTSSEIGKHLGVSENTIKSRLHRARQQLKKYDFMIQEVLDITITTKGEHRSQRQLKGETIMTNEVRNGSDVDARLEEMQRQIADLQERIKDIAANSDASVDSDKRTALDALLRLPSDAQDQITWCYAGAYRAASGQQSRRGSIWSDSIDNFISRAPDAEIVKLATFFTNPTVVAVLRQLVEGKTSVADLAKGCGIAESEMEKTVALLIGGSLVSRTEDDLIEPKNDAVFYFLNFVGMTRVYLNPKDH